MTEAPVAPHVDNDVAVEGLAEFDRDLAGKGDCLGVVAVDVEDRRLNALGDVRRIRRRTCDIAGEVVKSDLIIDDEVQAAASVVATDA